MRKENTSKNQSQIRILRHSKKKKKEQNNSENTIQEYTMFQKEMTQNGQNKAILANLMVFKDEDSCAVRQNSRHLGGGNVQASLRSH